MANKKSRAITPLRILNADKVSGNDCKGNVTMRIFNVQRCKKQHNVRKRRQNHSKKMMGGTSFNQPVCFSAIPRADYYDYNTYINDPSRQIEDARLMTGGKRRASKKRIHRSNKTFRKNHGRKQKGGYSLINNGLLSNAPIGPVGNFWTTSGTGLNYSVLSTGTAPTQGAIIPYNTNIPPSNMPALV